MYDWIIEADLYRYQQALNETDDRAVRDRLMQLIASARRRLFAAHLAAVKAAQGDLKDRPAPSSRKLRELDAVA